MSHFYLTSLDRFLLHCSVIKITSSLDLEPFLLCLHVNFLEVIFVVLRILCEECKIFFHFFYFLKSQNVFLGCLGRWVKKVFLCHSEKLCQRGLYEFFPCRKEAIVEKLYWRGLYLKGLDVLEALRI